MATLVTRDLCKSYRGLSVVKNCLKEGEKMRKRFDLRRQSNEVGRCRSNDTLVA